MNKNREKTKQQANGNHDKQRKKANSKGNSAKVSIRTIWVDSMVKWLAPWNLNPKTAVQLSEERFLNWFSMMYVTVDNWAQKETAQRKKIWGKNHLTNKTRSRPKKGTSKRNSHIIGVP